MNALALLLAVLAPAARAKDGAPSVEVFSLQVYRPPDLGQGDGIRFGRAATSSLNMEFFLRAPDCQILGLAPDALRVLSYSDESGTEMAMGVGIQLALSNRGMAANPDAHALALSLLAQRAPSPGAKTVSFKGEASLVCAEGAKKVHSQKLDLAPGTTVESGPFTIRVSPREWGGTSGGGWVMLELSGPLRQLESLRVLDSSERPIAMASRQNLRWSDSARPFQIQVRRPDAGSTSLEIEWYPKTRVARVPLRIETGIGL